MAKPYNEKNDKPQDKKTTRGLDKDELKKFKAMDKAQAKNNPPKTMKQDKKADEAMVKKIKKSDKDDKKKK